MISSVSGNGNSYEITSSYSASSGDAVAAVDGLEAELDKSNVNDNTVKARIAELQTMADAGAVDADLAARATTLLEQATVAEGVSSSTEELAVALKDQLSQISTTSSESTTTVTSAPVDTVEISDEAAAAVEEAASAITNTIAPDQTSSSANAVTAVDDLEAALNANNVSNLKIKTAIHALQTEADKGAVGADLAARAIPLLEQAAGTSDYSNVASMANDLKDQLVLSSKVQEFEDLVNSLENTDVSAEAINNILATVNSELNQAQADFADGTINKEQLGAALYTALDEGIASINSAIKEAEDAKTEELPPGLAEKEELPPGLAEKEELPPGLEATEETTEEATTSASIQLSITQILETIEGILNNLHNASVSVEGEDQEMEKETDPTKLAEELKEEISDLDKADYSAFTQKLRELGIDRSAVKKLFGDEGTMNTGGAINRIGDAGEGTGNFNATSFMTSMSSGINDALDSYKEVQKAEKEAKEEAEAEAKEEALGTLA